ncbi:hypothetical protein SSYRP_v1c07750 [Spiroplasma syrphidicola EA-1]|uniref:Uncharacterized protein n=1 Tax=Spiroplasma syrphidicola EA-1 TaxID=1276229 RepID=R4UJP4_9MOLU|nr:hypothetical protein [Spiroplasma syrphidicola]AGM26365.1 hypothetical protein SSYRP_v1c07750 [Spiroplasma syrphidicola EA-1]
MTRDEKEKVLDKFRKEIDPQFEFPCAICEIPVLGSRSLCMHCATSLDPKIEKDYYKMSEEDFWFKYYEKNNNL